MSKKGYIIIAIILLAIIAINLFIYKAVWDSNLPLWLKIALS